MIRIAFEEKTFQEWATKHLAEATPAELKLAERVWDEAHFRGANEGRIEGWDLGWMEAQDHYEGAEMAAENEAGERQGEEDPVHDDDADHYGALILYRYDGEDQDIMIDVVGNTRDEVLEDARRQAREILEEGIRFEVSIRRQLWEALPA